MSSLLSNRPAYDRASAFRTGDKGWVVLDVSTQEDTDRSLDFDTLNRKFNDGNTVVNPDRYLANCVFKLKRVQVGPTCWATAILNMLLHSPCLYQSIRALSDPGTTEKIKRSLDGPLINQRHLLFLSELSATLSSGDGQMAYSKDTLANLVFNAGNVCELVGSDGSKSINPTVRGLRFVHEALAMSASKPYTVAYKYLMKETTRYLNPIDSKEPPRYRYHQLYSTRAEPGFARSVADDEYELEHALFIIQSDAGSHVISAVMSDVLCSIDAQRLYFLIDSNRKTAFIEFDWSVFGRCGTLSEVHPHLEKMSAVLSQWRGTRRSDVLEVVLGYSHRKETESCIENDLQMRTTIEGSEYRPEYSLPQPKVGGAPGGETALTLAVAALSAAVYAVAAL